MPLITSPEYLAIDGVPLATPAWLITDHTPLQQPSDTVGSNRRLPGGRVLTYRRYVTETEITLPMVIFGDFDQEGAVQADSRVGLRQNTDYLKANILTVGAVVERTALWHFFGEGRQAQVQVHLKLGERKAAVCRARLELVFPHGMFATTTVWTP